MNNNVEDETSLPMSTDNMLEHRDQEVPMVCSECLEPVTREYEPWSPHSPAMWRWTGGHTHEDGEPLCPVVGDNGYEPCKAIAESDVDLELDPEYPDPDAGHDQRVWDHMFELAPGRGAY